MKKMHVLPLNAVVLFITYGSSISYADFWSDAGNLVTAPITAPLEATKDIINGDDPGTVVTKRIDKVGQNIQRVTNGAEQVQRVVLNLSRDSLRNGMGDDWAKGFDILTASERVKFELQLTSGRFIGGCLRGDPCDLQHLAAMPLAAAMRDAYKTYYPYSAQMNGQLQQTLSVVIPPNVLQTARFTVGSTPDFTVPGFLNAANEAFSQGHAVTLANVIVFSRDTDTSTCGDFIWMLHELRHIQQYMYYSGDVLESIDGFAVDYMSNYESMEQDAQNTALGWTRQLGSYYGFTC